eukprot:11225715-Lingulodinium_polyedra.AAC.1
MPGCTCKPRAMANEIGLPVAGGHPSCAPSSGAGNASHGAQAPGSAQPCRSAAGCPGQEGAPLGTPCGGTAPARCRARRPRR